MLSLERKLNQTIVFDLTTASDEDIAALRAGTAVIGVVIARLSNDKARLGCTAPKSVGIHRKEFLDAIQSAAKAVAK